MSRAQPTSSSFKTFGFRKIASRVFEASGMCTNSRPTWAESATSLGISLHCVGSASSQGLGNFGGLPRGQREGARRNLPKSRGSGGGLGDRGVGGRRTDEKLLLCRGLRRWIVPYYGIRRREANQFGNGGAGDDQRA